MEKMKPVIPTLKEKKRYIAFEIISDKPIAGFSAASKAIWKACLGFMGEMGTGKAGIWLVPEMYNEKRQRGIIRTNNKMAEQVKASFMFVRKISRQNVIVKSRGMSGMLTKAYKNYVE